MIKAEITAFFNQCAPTWDERMVRNEEVIRFILDKAGIAPGVSVLDIGCGTGVLFNDYLHRGVSRVTGVDISLEMTAIAGQKFTDSRIQVICGDAEVLQLEKSFDCCVIYNAFPHFPNPNSLLRQLSTQLKPGGRLTVAHGMSLGALRRHHAKKAQNVSRKMFPAPILAKMMAPFFKVDNMVSDHEKYLVTGIINR